MIINLGGNFHFPFFKPLKNPVKVAFYNNCLKNGGIERVTSILLYNLSKEKSFIFYIITISGIIPNEYSIPNNVKRISLFNKNSTIFEVIEKENIDILIYNNDKAYEIEQLNKLNKIKVIYCIHSSFLFWIYYNQYYFGHILYEAYKKCKYVIALIPIENDYLFKKWGINSILMNNPLTFEYDLVIPSDLSQKNIIMIGRASSPEKRYELGILAMKDIIREIPECRMIIVSAPTLKLCHLIKNINITKNVEIVGFHQNPEPYLKNSSLHILPSSNEAYPMVLSEAKVFGIPTILCGLDYLALSKGGTVIIYDDNPVTIAKEAIKILKDIKYRKQLGKAARQSMEKINNKNIAKKWVKIILSVYQGITGSSYSKLFSGDNKRVTEKEANMIINNQLNLLKKRKKNLYGITLDTLKNYSINFLYRKIHFFGIQKHSLISI